MFLSDDDIKFNWETWGNTKPWYCTKCDSLLANDTYAKCDGTDPEMPRNLWNPHEVVEAQPPLTYDQFKEIIRKQNSM